MQTKGFRMDKTDQTDSSKILLKLTCTYANDCLLFK